VHQEYHTILKIRTDWSDLDLFGHVNNVAFFRYIQAARVSYCDQVGLSSIDPFASPGFMVVSSSCQFKKPLRYPGEVTVHTRVDWMKNTSFQLSYLLKDGASDVCAEAQDVMVVYDHAHKQKITIPASLRESISVVEGHSL
jgi:acyl-CoA thioester hydrolase